MAKNITLVLIFAFVFRVLIYVGSAFLPFINFSVDFDPNGDPSSLTMPSFALAEVTDDERFTGARLALTTSSQVKALLDEFKSKAPSHRPVETQHAPAG